jgi:anti-sigma B factor antagonist
LEPISTENETEGLEDAPEPQIIRDTRTENGITVIAAEGEIDLATTPQLTAALEEAAMASPYVIVDLSAVTYMDSSGFGALLGATKTLRPGGNSLYLVGCSSNIERMLVITRLSTIFSIHTDEAEARRAIAELESSSGESGTGTTGTTPGV